jgi:type IV pilus assembly protein PilV
MKKPSFPDHRSKPIKSCTGFSLIEVLIALLILAVGVLGIAALQFKALRYSYDTNVRNQISFLASDIADRMRINRTNIATYVGNYTVDIDNLGANACSNTTGGDKDNDLGCWHNAVDATLPHDSTADITVNGSLYTVAMAWTDREGQTHTIEYSFQ